MSSGEDDRNDIRQPSHKRRRRANACDMCRKRKIKCDGKQRGTGKCTNCNVYEWECTQNIAPRTRYSLGYVEALQTKVKRLEDLVKRLAPDQDFTQDVGYELTPWNWMEQDVLGKSPLAQNKPSSEPKSPSVFVFGSSSLPANTHGTSPPAATSPNAFNLINPEQAPTVTPMPDDEHSDDDGSSSIRAKLPQLRNSARIPFVSNYFGKSSSSGLINMAFAMYKQHHRQASIENLFGNNELYEQPAWMDKQVGSDRSMPLQFPDPSLIDALAALYFENVNILAPVLHRATFMSAKASGLHLRNRAFGSVVLLVCALGAHFSNDRRVLSESDQTWHSAGWRWYTQASAFEVAKLEVLTSHLYELQVICLAAMYTVSISPFHAWVFSGVGVRIALDIGAHKRRAYGSSLTIEEELYKRAFWVLIRLDRTISTALGRPCNIQEEDFDVEMPLCIDDEYMSYLAHEDARLLAKQPDDKPSLMAYFICSLRLAQIQGLAQRTIHASTKARAHYNFQGEDWMNRMVTHLDSLLNSWSSSVPEHLQLDHARENGNHAFYVQSTHLYTQYHELQIMIHRHFLSSAFPAPLPLLPLAICMNSARALTRMIVELHERGETWKGIFHWSHPHWSAGILLIIGLGNARVHKVVFNHKQALSDLKTIIRILRTQDNRWRWVGRHANVLERLKIIGEMDENEMAATRQNKRAHTEDVAPSAQTQLAAPKPSLLSTSNFDNIDWDMFSVFGHAGMAPAANIESFPQTTDPVLGNVDFAALFGFGNPSAPGARPYSPPPFDTVAAAEGVQAMEAGFDSWSGLGFNIGVNEWQGTA